MGGQKLGAGLLVEVLGRALLGDALPVQWVVVVGEEEEGEAEGETGEEREGGRCRAGLPATGGMR